MKHEFDEDLKQFSKNNEESPCSEELCLKNRLIELTNELDYVAPTLQDILHIDNTTELILNESDKINKKYRELRRTKLKFLKE